MADIKIVQDHQLNHKKAREAAEQVAQEMAAEFDMECQWQGDVLHFERGGVAGSLTLRQHQAEMRITLGFLFSAFAAKIERKVAENMQKVFGGAA